MEPLVIVSAAVVFFYSYLTVREIIQDLASDGTWQAAQEYWRELVAASARLGRQLYPAKSRTARTKVHVVWAGSAR